MEENTPTPFEEEQQLASASLNPYPSVLQTLGLAGFAILMSIVVGLVLLIIVSLATVGAGEGITEALESGQQVLQQPWMFLLTYLLTFTPVVALGVYLKRRQEKRRDIFSFASIPTVVYPLLVLGTLAIIFLLDPITDLIPWELPEAMLAFVKQKDVFTFLAMVIAAPIFEELIFRGLMLEGLLQRMSHWKAILFTSFLFGVVHLNPWQFVAAFFLGLFIGWVYWKTRSLIPCIFIHFVANLNGYLMRFFIDMEVLESGNLPSTRESFGSFGGYLMFLVACAALAGASIFLINRFTSGNNDPSKELPTESP